MHIHTAPQPTHPTWAEPRAFNEVDAFLQCPPVLLITQRLQLSQLAFNGRQAGQAGSQLLAQGDNTCTQAHTGT